MYVCGFEVVDPSLREQQVQLIDTLKSRFASEHVLYRATMRSRYCGNYLFSSLSMVAGGWAVEALGHLDPKQNFELFLPLALRWGAGLSGALLGAVCFICIFAASRGALTWAVLGAVCIAAICFVLLPYARLSWIFLKSPPWMRTFHETFGLSLYSWINPSAAFSPFSVYPRCLSAMLAFTAFVLRWSGCPRVAYWLPLLVCFVHQSEAPILLGAMIVCDLFLGPRILLRKGVAAPIVVTLVVIALRERMFDILGFSWTIAALGIACLAGLTFLALRSGWLRGALDAVSNLYFRYCRWLQSLERPLAEAIILFGLWLLIYFICYSFRNDTFYRVIYFWSELPPRVVGLFQLPVIAGLTYPLWVALMRRGGIAREILPVATILVMTMLAVAQWRAPWHSTTDLENRSRDLELDLAKGYSSSESSFIRIESPWYYLMVKRAYVGSISIADYFSDRKAKTLNEEAAR